MLVIAARRGRDRKPTCSAISEDRQSRV